MYNFRTMLTRKWNVTRTAFVALFVLTPIFAIAQTPASDVPIDEVIRRFAEKEKEFKKARDNYAFRQEVKVQELSDSDRVLGEYQTVTDITFDDKGKRRETIVKAPP